MGIFKNIKTAFSGAATTAAVAAAIAVFAGSPAEAASVAVHDPSIIVVYKDASGNSYPENDAAKTRTKYYYLFGTQNGAAYSRDMLDWTAFTPKLSRGGTTYVSGATTDDYYTLIKAEADYAEHTTSDAAHGNLWAPDIIWNKKMQKWCLYFSEAGEDWKSSIILFTSSNIEGPFEYVGSAVYGGMDTGTAGSIANTDYQKVTGSSTIDSRYYIANNGSTNMGKWDGGYGVSAIDPTVFYDEDGNLWLLYGSWSGGLFMLKLDESTGLRDYTYKYTTTWNGTAFKSGLASDEYMGIHIGGGYYVSGEGSYIQYFKDADGNGYYYLFVSYGFYSPEGGYTMRVFRSKDVKGPYTDVDGTSAIFSKYVMNYWGNTDYGYPIIANYRWSFWADDHAEISDGHNSLLRDDDGNMYLIYHRKYNNHTAWHNVEVHQLYFNKTGWIVAAPFEYHEGYGMPSKALTREDIAGAYKVIMHNPAKNSPSTWADSVAVNEEQDMMLNADGSVSGAYTGTWAYDYANGRSYATLTLGGVTYNGVMLDQLENDISKRTVTFTSMNAAGNRTFWGYKVPKTAVVNETRYFEDTKIGATDFSTAWDAYDVFKSVKGTGNFVAEFDFVNNVKDDAENWNNWVLAFKSGDNTWYLRSDSYSVDTFGGDGTVTYWSAFADWDAFKKAMAGAKLRVRAEREGTIINVFASLRGASSDGSDSVVYAATATGVPTDDMDIYLGVDAAYLNLERTASGTLNDRTIVGTINDGGEYNAAFNNLKSDDYAVSGDFTAKFDFMNYGNKLKYGNADGSTANNWDNYIVRATAGGTTTLLRADAYAMDNAGTFTYDTDWSWDDFETIMRNAHVQMDISRVKDTITYSATITAQDGKAYHYKAVNVGASTDDMTLGFTCEKSAVDLMKVSMYSTVGDSVKASDGTDTPLAITPAATVSALSAQFHGRTLEFTNPASGLVKVQLFDVTGHMVMNRSAVYEAATHQLDLGAISQGRYLVRISTLGAQKVLPIIVK